MAHFFILVMSSCIQDDPDYWYFTDWADSEAELQRLHCFGSVTTTPKDATVCGSTPKSPPIPPCGGGAPEAGTIYWLERDTAALSSAEGNNEMD